MKQEELGFYETVERNTNKIKRIVRTVLYYLGFIVSVIGAFWVFGTIGAADNGAIDIHQLIWQMWTGFVIFAAGVAVWLIGYEIKE